MDLFIADLTKLIHQLDTSGYLLPVAVAFSVLLFLCVWLLVRGLRLWYWKVNVQIETLQSIEKKLDNLGQGSPPEEDSASEKPIPAVSSKPYMGEEPKAEEEAQEKQSQEEHPEQEQEDEGQPPEEQPRSEDFDPEKSAELEESVFPEEKPARSQMGKFGKIYTEEELESLIKD